MTLEDSVLSVFREVFDDPGLIITKETNASEIEIWDSFYHITLIVSLEERFDVEFTTQEVGSMTCVGDLYEVLKGKGTAA